MRIIPEHYQHIKAAMMAPEVSSKVPTLHSYTIAGLTEKRWRWDWLYRAGLSKWLCDNVYKYANDDHIDTAIKKITGGV